MCRGKKRCSELDDNQSAWDSLCPLRPPEWIDEEINTFIEAVEFLEAGKKENCLQKIASIRSDEITAWYIEHGQMSGMHRKNILKIEVEESTPENHRDPLRAPKKYQSQVFKRDGCKCRYCGSRLVSQNFMKLFIKNLDSPVFKKGPNNLATHGIIHAMWPVADHVIPWVLGGKTNLDNLVTSCGPCNYGKAGYTIEQIGIQNPFSSPVVSGCWDGLESKIESIKLPKTV